MKRSDFMNSVSEPSARQEIAEDKISEHKPLSALSEDFRKDVKWFGPDAPSDSDDSILQIIRLPDNEPNPTEECSIGFVDRQTYKGPPERISPEAHSEVWESILNQVRPPPLEIYKAGSVVWDHLQLPDEADWVSEVLGLRRIDRSTTRAYRAALMAAVMTKSGAVDIDTIHVALATFIHASSRFMGRVKKVKWHLPFGPSTAVLLMRSRK